MHIRNINYVYLVPRHRRSSLTNAGSRGTSSDVIDRAAESKTAGGTQTPAAFVTKVTHDETLVALSGRVSSVMVRSVQWAFSCAFGSGITVRDTGAQMPVKQSKPVCVKCSVPANDNATPPKPELIQINVAHLVPLISGSGAPPFMLPASQKRKNVGRTFR